MKIDIHRLGSVTVISPRAAIAQDDVGDFAQAVEEQLFKNHGRIVLEFSQVPYLDSRGVEALWDLADRQREAGQSLRIAAVPELCREVLELTQVAEHLDLFDSPENAVRSFL
jgi:anti-anti-sigma factor